MTKALEKIKCGAFVVIFALGILVSPAKADRAFLTWIENFYPIAAEYGVLRSTYNKAFDQVSQTDQRILDRIFKPSKYKRDIWDYMDQHINTYSIDGGIKAKLRHKTLLNALQAQYGVDQHILLALWSVESAYGRKLKDRSELYNATHALATLAFINKKKAQFAKKQLIANLQIIQEGRVSPNNMYSSWSGKLGLTRVNPIIYQSYAVDADRDGKKDVWYSVPDSLATTANFLNQLGWRKGHSWGYETIGPLYAYRFRNQTRRVSQWIELGFKPANSKSFSHADDLAELKFLAGPHGPAFLVKQNFYVLKQHNDDDAFALAVGLLSDRLKGKPQMKRDWPRPEGALNLDQKIELQRALYKLGLFKAPIDGNIGPSARAAIMAFQRRYGIEVDNKVSKDLLAAVKQATNS